MEKLIIFRADEYDRDGLLSVAEVAAKCSLSKAAIYNEIRSGLLVGHLLAGKTVLRPVDAENWARARAVKITRMTPRSRRGRKRKIQAKGVTNNARKQEAKMPA